MIPKDFGSISLADTELQLLQRLVDVTQGVGKPTRELKWWHARALGSFIEDPVLKNTNIDVPHQNVNALERAGFIEARLESDDLSMVAITPKAIAYIDYVGRLPLILGRRRTSQEALQITFEKIVELAKLGEVTQQRIAEELELDQSVITTFLETLVLRRLIATQQEQTNVVVTLTTDGRMTAIDPSYVMQTGGGNNVTFLAPVSNTNLNIDAILNNVTQTIDVSSSMSPGTKEELQGLVEELAQQLKKVEKSHPEETEAIGEAAQSVINAATKDKPNRTTIKVSADGLKEAASTIAVAAPLALQAAQKIVDFIRANWL